MKGYGEIHRWMVRNFGPAKAHGCMICGRTDGKIDWANLDHKYTKDLSTWTTLCANCHWDHDHLILGGRTGERAYWKNKRIPMQTDKAKQEFLLTKPQANVYRIIAKNPEVAFGEIASKLGVSIGAIQGVVRALVKKGYLKSENKVSRFELCS